MQPHSSSTTQLAYHKQSTFRLDPRDSPIPTYLFVAITSRNALEIFAVSFNELTAEQMNFNDSLKLVLNIGSKTYLSDADLPKKLFQMKSIPKIFDYFADETNRVIRASAKTKNETQKIILEPMVPVTRNIHDFVPLQLDFIDPKSITELADSKHKFLKSIFEQMQSDEREKIEQTKRMKQLEEERKQLQEKKNKSRDDIVMESGEIDLSEFSSKPNISSLFQTQPTEPDMKASCQSIVLEKAEQGYLWIDWESRQNKEYQQRQVQEWEEGLNFRKNDQFQEENLMLQNEHIAILEQNNQQLLKRVIKLQTLLIKKTFRIDQYEDFQSSKFESIPQKYPFQVPLDLVNKVTHSCAVLETKYEEQIQKSVEAVESLRLHFGTLKQVISSIQERKQQSILRGKRTVGKQQVTLIMGKIQEIFESF